MHIGIDASNIRLGGGVTHLVELLRAANPNEHDIARITVWGNSKTLGRIEDRPWLDKVHERLLDRALPLRLYWQRFKLQELARRKGCNLLFFPGGSYTGSFRPFVAMSQNMLPFEWSEARRYGLSIASLRIALLRKSQSNAFTAADGMIFISSYAANKITRKVKLTKEASIIHHGINGNFLACPRSQKGIGTYSPSAPFRILYVSIVSVYKHQWHVAKAIATLAKRGFPLQLDLVGPADTLALQKLREWLARLDPEAKILRYVGPVPYESLPSVYREADLFVFASSCENMPIILLEAMASGLPIASSRYGPMPEMLKDAGLYFDPESPEEIADTVEELLTDHEKRSQCATRAYEYAKEYSWNRCAGETFSFLSRIARKAQSGVLQERVSYSATGLTPARMSPMKHFVPGQRGLEIGPLSKCTAKSLEERTVGLFPSCLSSCDGSASILMSGEPMDPVQFHDKLAIKWELKYEKASFQDRMKALFSLLGANGLQKQKWLDAGCGTGVLARALAAKGCSVTGVDASSQMIQAARNSGFDQDDASVDDPVFEVVESIERLDFSESSFDGILCSSVLEYVGNPDKAILEFYRILRPGGTLLVSVPNKISLLRNMQKILYAVLQNCFKVRWPAYLAFSKHSYTFKSFGRVLRDNGFTVLSSTRYGPYIPDLISRMEVSASTLIFLARKDNV